MITHLTPILAGHFELDGGAMFGVVPKSVWERAYPPEAGTNRCRWAARCLLIETEDGRRVLVDTGVGDKDGERFRSHFNPTQPSPLTPHLRARQTDPQTITDVLFTHLHFDHSGGASRLNEDGTVHLTFPEATHWVSDRHWRWAREPNVREAGSFLPANLDPLATSGRLQFLDAQRDDLEFLPGVRLRTLYGHTEAMQMLLLDLPGGGTAAYCADLLPSHAHLGLAWGMAYDVRPLDTMAEKKRLLAEAEAGDWLLIFEHDTRYAAGRLGRDERGRLRWRELLETVEFQR